MLTNEHLKLSPKSSTPTPNDNICLTGSNESVTMKFTKAIHL